jgi:hypothetical protein
MPEYGIRMEALTVLLNHSKPAEADASAVTAREQAIVRIERILERRGLRGAELGPAGSPMEFETAVESSLAGAAGDESDEADEEGE